ncbi:hypothetical protein [Erythrobacter sp.]|uniref:hypothetical protein n=1 Tax=Erythrobacter sp. TaxID=1042 RepID=UPI0025F4718C|nr:hypothetical protein [Erythrobacter sp.]
MSVHFNLKEAGFFSLEDWPVTVCAWRGCCIEVFAQGEHAVADCLSALEKAGIMLPKDARSPMPVTRLRGLKACIESHDFGKHGELARQRIDHWENVCKQRASLAHGRIKATADGVIISHRVFDGSTEWPQPPERLSRMDMLVSLQEISRAQQLLHQQLRQIEALAADAASATSRSDKKPPQ